MTIDSILEWFDPETHPLHILIVGAVAGQLVLALPDSRFKTYATNILHGLFPSPQVFANGAPTAPKAIEVFGELLHTEPTAAPVAVPAAVPVAESTKEPS